MGFVDGLNPVVKCCLCEWPDTSNIAGMSQDRLNELMIELEKSMPRWPNDREQCIYRLFLEHQGQWHILERLFLTTTSPGDVGPSASSAGLNV
jgi:hypothetical protein